jgi:DNA-binding MarR family transcriptional regulator
MTTWLDTEEMRAWRGFLSVFADVHAALDAELLAEHGLSEGDYGVLVRLSEASDHCVRMCDLAAFMHLSPSGITRRLDGLVRDGLVERVAGAEDRRVTFARITPAGMRRLEAAAPDHVDSVRRQLLDHLSRTQIRQLGAAFDAVMERRARAGVGCPRGDDLIEATTEATG